MAYRRTLATKAKQFAQQRFSPTSFAYLHHHDEDRKIQPRENPKMNNLIQSSFIHTSLGFGGCGGGAGKFRDRRCSQFDFHPMMMSAMVSGRYMSTTVGDGAGDIDYMTDMADVLSEKTVEAVANTTAAVGPVASEVAVAAADSFPPVAALQYVIDGVHNFTGFEWWASIVLTTVLIRTLTIPVLINQLKATSKLTLMRPKLEAIKEEMQSRGMSPSAVAEGQAEMKKLFKEHGVSTFTPLKGLFISGPIFISFFLAIQNMVEKVPSFKTGGAFWFTDLTTPDALHIFPVLTALTFWITVEFNMQEGMEGNPAAKTMKNVSRAFAALSIPLTMSFPKAIFCYWITSNLFSLVYGFVIKRHSVKRFLNIPIIVPPPADTSKSEPAFSFWEGLKKYAAAQAQQQKLAASSAKSIRQSMPSPSSIEPSASSPTLGKKLASQKISPTAVLSHRIQSLEKEVKGRKKNKRR